MSQQLETFLSNKIIAFFLTVVKLQYIVRFKRSEEKPDISANNHRYIYGWLDRNNIRLYVTKSQDDLQKRLRCKFTIIYDASTLKR